MYIASQVLAVVADTFYCFAMFSKNKIKLVVFLFLTDVLFASHYLILGGQTGACLLFLDAIFLICIYILEVLNKTKFNLFVTLITMLIAIIVVGLTWSGFISLFPLLSLLIYLVGMIFRNVLFNKIGAFFRNFFNIIYLFLLNSYLGLILEICLLFSAVIGILIQLKQKVK